MQISTVHPNITYFSRLRVEDMKQKPPFYAIHSFYNILFVNWIQDGGDLFTISARCLTCRKLLRASGLGSSRLQIMTSLMSAVLVHKNKV